MPNFQSEGLLPEEASLQPISESPLEALSKATTVAKQFKHFHYLGMSVAVAILILVTFGFLLVACSAEFHDEEYSRLWEAVEAKYLADDRIPSMAMGFDTHTNSNLPKETWLAIELSFTENCTETTDDPCEALANEMARIVVEQYKRVDDLSGLRIILTNDAVYGSVDATSPNAHLGQIVGSTFDRSPDHLVKSLTITEWRQALKKSVVPYGG